MIDNDGLNVPLDVEILKKYCLWIIFKFISDPHHKQQNSSRSDLIGGFIDRWINKIPETLIFNKLLDKYDANYEIINDYFFYKEESAKNAPDILGLKYHNNILKFASFNEYNWNINKDAPFIEVKTFRDTQKLITIPSTQFFGNHYYAFIESNVNKLYLLQLFDKKNFLTNDKYYSMFDDIKEFNESKNNILKNPTDIIKKESLNNDLDENNLGGYKLIGVYKGEFLRDYSIEVGKRGTGENVRIEKPRYLDSIEKFNYDEIDDVPSGEFDYYTDIKQSIPIMINIENNSKVYLVGKSDSKLILKVNGTANIYSDVSIGKNSKNFNEKLKDSFYILEFKEDIRDLTKYYYLYNIEEKANLNVDDSIELHTGILNFFGNEFNNNKFELIKSEDTDFFITHNLKTTFHFYIGDVGIIKYKKNNEYKEIKLEKGFYKMKFNNGNYNECKKDESHINKFSLSEYNLNPCRLNIKLKSNNSKLKFIKKNKNNFILKIEGEGSLNNYDIKDNFYNVNINQNKINEPNELEYNPILKDTSKIEQNGGFYYHLQENNEKNVPVKISIKNGSSLVFHVKSENVVYAKVNGKEVFINDVPVSSGENDSEIWKLSFKRFDRSSKKNEYVISKNALIASGKTFEDDLINDFNKFIKLNN